MEPLHWLEEILKSNKMYNMHLKLYKYSCDLDEKVYGIYVDQERDRGKPGQLFGHHRHEKPHHKEVCLAIKDTLCHWV